jgi:hypothetical protein
MVQVFALTDPSEIWVLDARDMGSAFSAAKYRARRRGGSVDGAAPVPDCIASIHDDGDGAVSRVRRRLERWKVVGCRFVDCADSRAEVARIQEEDLHRRMMIV